MSSASISRQSRLWDGFHRRQTIRAPDRGMCRCPALQGVEWHKATVFDAKPASPMWRVGISNIGDPRTTVSAFEGKDGRWHAPPRHRQLTAPSSGLMRPMTVRQAAAWAQACHRQPDRSGDVQSGRVSWKPRAAAFPAPSLPAPVRPLSRRVTILIQRIEDLQAARPDQNQ